MPLKRNVARELPVILIDSTDFITGLTPVVFGDVACKYRKDASTTWVIKTINAGNWGINTNKPAGNYTIDFTGTELNTNGLFEYNVVVVGAITFSGLFEIRDNTNDDLNTAIATRSTPTNITDAHSTTDGKIDAVKVDTAETLILVGTIDGNVDDIETIVNAILVDTNEMQSKLPAATIAGEAEATTNKEEVIAEIDENEAKIDAIQASNDLTSNGR